MAATLTLHVTACSTFQNPLTLLSNGSNFMEYAPLEGVSISVYDADGVTLLTGTPPVPSTDNNGYLLIGGLSPEETLGPSYLFVEANAIGYVTKRIKLNYTGTDDILYCAARLVPTTIGGV